MPSGYGFRSSILRYLCPTKSSFFENLWWRHCMWFVVRAPPQSKILATPMVPCPPFRVASIVGLAQNSTQNCGMPPSFGTWIVNLSRKSDWISEDLWLSSPEKRTESEWRPCFLLVLIFASWSKIVFIFLSKFLATHLGPPTLSKIMRTLVGLFIYLVD